MTPDPDLSGFTLVLMARGAADRDQLVSLLQSDDLSIRIGDQPERRMTSTGLDISSSGDGPQAIHRMWIRLQPVSAPLPGPHAPESRSIEDRLDEIIALLKEIRDQG